MTPETRARRALYRRSILDLTRENTRKVVADLGAADRRKIDEYLTSIREVETADRERRKRQSRTGSAGREALRHPVPVRRYLKLMFDLQAIAFQSDLTRVSTLMLGREGSVRTYPEIGVADPHHPLTHHRDNPDFIEKVTKINCLHVELFAYFLEKLKATPDGDGTLLDHSPILYGSALSDGNSHAHYNLPLAGGRRRDRHGRTAYPSGAEDSGDEPVSVTLMPMRFGVAAESFG